jgi:hypothetical protein
MDPIECIAQRLVVHCSKSLNMLLEINAIIESSETMDMACEQIRSKKFEAYVNLGCLDLVRRDIGMYQNFLGSVDEIKHMARKVFVTNFFDTDVFYVFNQEISFSYACKMLSQVEPTLAHFSNHVTIQEVRKAEVELACKANFADLNGKASELLCLEAMPTMNADVSD